MNVLSVIVFALVLVLLVFQIVKFVKQLRKRILLKKQKELEQVEIAEKQKNDIE